MKDGLPEIVIRESSSGTEILVNGRRIEGVSSYSVKHEAGKVPILKLDFPAVHATFEGRLVPELPEVFKDFYTLI